MKKLALIGCGGIGGYHLEHFVQLTDLVELAGFCDLIQSRAEDFVKQAGSGKAFTDFSAMFDEIKPDMVFVCVPPTEHGIIEFECIRRGIPFFVEKPLALDAEMAKEISRQIDETGLLAASGFQCRYDSINAATKEFIATHPIVHIQGSRVGGIPDVPWWRIKSTSGGQLVEQTIHQLDMLRFLLGEEPKTVYSVAGRGFVTQEECPGYYTDDITTTLITFESGITCTMVTGCYALASSSWDSKMTFGARDSRLDYYLITKSVLYGTEKEGAAENLGGVVSGDGMQRIAAGEGSITIESANDYGMLCDRTFIEAALSGDQSKVLSPYSDALKSVIFSLACNESMETGQPVVIDYSL